MTNFNVQLELFYAPDQPTIERLVKRPSLKRDKLEDIIDRVFNAVKRGGDEAIIELTEQFDNVYLDEITVSPEEIAEGISNTSKALKGAIDFAYENIKKFHEAQRLKVVKIETTKGVQCWQESRAIEKIGLYVPGGSAPLFSTVLMLGIPAMVAKCNEIVLCTPPNQDGKIHSAILYAADKCGIRKIIKAGGSQAIAGMVHGTESIPAVYKIFGPGNQFVTAAKLKGMNFGVAIDLPAGPSEVLVFADETANPAYIAADLLSQAEHGIDSQVVFVSTKKELASEVNLAMSQQLKDLSRADTAILALANAFTCIFDNTTEAFRFINQYAPEHLILASDNAETLLDHVINAGSVFIGHYSPESAGDYASGTNHTLPTAAYSRAYSGVSLDAFVKKITFQKLTREGLQKLGPAIITMAENEQLTAHAAAVTIRLNDL